MRRSTSQKAKNRPFHANRKTHTTASNKRNQGKRVDERKRRPGSGELFCAGSMLILVTMLAWRARLVSYQKHS